jgi:TetR/AcrR family transcriptional regulator, cholesterol catabolism regulator
MTNQVETLEPKRVGDGDDIVGHIDDTDRRRGNNTAPTDPSVIDTYARVRLSERLRLWSKAVARNANALNEKNREAGASHGSVNGGSLGQYGSGCSIEHGSPIMSALILSVLIIVVKRGCSRYCPQVTQSSSQTRTQLKKLDKRARIAAAAGSLFREFGYEGATTRAIAQRAGIAHGTLFLYARDKDEALALVYEDDVRAMLEARLNHLPARANARTRIVYIARGFFELYSEYPDLARRFVQSIPRIDESRRESHDALNARIAAAIHAELVRGCARGELRPRLDTAVATANVFAILRVHVFGWLSAPPCHVDTGVSSLNTALRQLFEGIVESSA